ncbi:hypothetical protein ACFWJQ_25385 [Streptomyces goshikiensis]|uniref:hypothetical protein n=1 Tax=Streptomyces goshikiensis TaxID=1942 RepID=UPI00364BE100
MTAARIKQSEIRSPLLPDAEGPVLSGRRPWAWIQADPATPGASPVNDQPVSFDPARRAHGTRGETRTRVAISADATEWDIIP